MNGPERPGARIVHGFARSQPSILRAESPADCGQPANGSGLPANRPCRRPFIQHAVRPPRLTRPAMNDQPEARVIWIDVAKTVGIFLVVFSQFDQNGLTESVL